MNHQFAAEGLCAAARAVILASLLLVAGCNSGRGGGPSSQPPPPSYSVGGTVSGLSGNQVTLRLNGGTDFVVGTNGAFTFPGATPVGTAYTATVQVQPTAPSQTCVLTNATGTVAAAVTNITVTCTTNTYRVRGTLRGLAAGSVILRNNGGDDLSLAANGAFVFAASVPSGGAYAVTVQSHPVGPSQTCVVTQGSGSVAAADVDTVAVDCTTNAFMVGGTIVGLTGSGLVLRNNGGNDLVANANGSFAFSTPVLSGAGYAVTVLTDPTGPVQRCTVTNGTGIVGAANVGSVTVTCRPLHTIGGTVRGLDVGGLILRNAGGDDLNVTNGTFTFATPVALGTTYDVTAVVGTPASPRHVCQVTQGSGTVAGNVTDVQVSCEADRFAYIAHYSTVSFDGPGLISALVMNHETGALAPIAGTSTFPLDNGSVQILSDPRGRFVYVAHTAVYTQAGSVSGFSVNPATGALTPVPGATFLSGSGTSGLAIDSEGKFLFAANAYSNDVSVWVIQSNGSLTPAPGSPYYIGDTTRPVGVATSVAGQCCHLYVAHSNINGVPQVSAFSYNATSGALTPLAGSPFSAGLSAYTPSSLLVNNAGDKLYMANSGTSNISTFDIAGGTGTLTQRTGSPSPGRNANCALVQPALSDSLLVVSSLSYELSLFRDDPATGLPAWVDSTSMFAGSYCSVGADPYGKFMYVPKFDDIADYLFGFTLGANGTKLDPLTLNPTAPQNTYTLTAIHPRAMVIRNSRRDREVLQITN